MSVLIQEETLNSEHFLELSVESGINPELIALNFQSMSGDRVYDSLCSSPNIKRLNTGRLPQWVMTLMEQPEQGGWWCSGLDPLDDWKDMWWGCFKPDTPRLEKPKGFDPDAKPKAIKYEHPLKTKTRAFFLRVPDSIWEAIAQRHGLIIRDSDRELGFWQWVWEHPSIPVLVTEGVKKAACLLSNGYAAIALPGISMGYRAIKNESGTVLRRELIPELQHFATLGREFIFCFDHETKQKTIQSVNTNLGITASLLTKSASQVKVIQLPGPQKGVDDFIVAQGAEAFDACYQQAISVDEWQSHQPHLLTYTPTVVVNQRYLGELDLPNSGLALIKSPKGTGKTTALEKRIDDATQEGRRCLVISHRIQLGRGICAKLGINYIDEVRESETGGMFGYGLCIDSLHPDSQARFNPHDWKGAIIVLDEVEQVLWHVLNSSTCYHTRVAILKTLKTLIEVVIKSEGLIIAQDADLSDLSVDYLLALANTKLDPWLLVNQYKPENGWDVYFYETPDPSPVVGKILSLLQDDKRCYVALDAQKAKSRWGSKNLESYLAKKFPEKKILRIDSETVCDPESAAYGIIDHLNEDLLNYDIVIATPSLGTGVSIDVKGHFHAVFGIYQGAIPSTEIRQAIARVREEVPRYVWAKTFSACKVGNGSLHYRNLLKSVQQFVKRTIVMLKDVDFNVDAASDPISLRTWAKMAARVNGSMQRYRESLRAGLIEEGHTLYSMGTDPNPDGSKKIKQDITEERDTNRQSEAQAIADAPEIDPIEAARLKDKRAKTDEERRMYAKHDLQTRYGIDVTAELKLKHDDGWYRKLQLHYFLTHDPQQVRDRDKTHLSGHIERGGGQICLQDMRLLTGKVEALKIFKIETFMDPDRLLRKTDEDLIAFQNLAFQYRNDIKTVLGFRVSDNANPIQVLGMFLNSLGLKLECVKREVLKDGSRQRVYRYLLPHDGREQVFAFWKEQAERPQADITDQTNAASGQMAA
ncbi:plasmid replication protein, CyRepA1 family [Lyngbya confervoides]|uniref:DUF3854 domain-containing protein n=1 Tax=Lyngbya confervoides BDU141951 TaxID=1574623 RepID=A0ABD4T9J0_9CYAN|nr:plasmid replication protein, CyRepA1 family [Lyngbya confervoides]MCM1985103.1 DUF3854 domain-containing protein [Lyngbya confervoides BDU141951]